MKNKLRVLIVTPLYPPDIGGPATYTRLLEEELPSRGLDVSVVSFGEVRHLPKFFRHVVLFVMIWRQSRAVDVIYAQDPVSVGLPSMVAAKLSGIKFVLKVVGDYAWEQGVQRFGVKKTLDQFVDDGGRYSVSVRLLQFVQTSVARRADLIITPSKYLKSIVSKWGIAPGNISVVYNSFNLPNIRGVEIDRSNQNAPIIVSAGRLVPWKGFDGLIKVVSKLVSIYPKLQLYIYGTGPDYEKLDRSIDQFNLHGHVFLKGGVSQDELLRQVKWADMFVLNTAYEGLSHVLLEVMSLGTPIITTSVGGNKELITDGLDGLLVDFDDYLALSGAIQSLADNPYIGQELSDHAKQTVTKFSQKDASDELVRLLLSLEADKAQ